MFQEEQKQIEQQIYTIFKENSIPLPEDLGWVPVPFSGEWGISTSFFKVVALEAKSGKSLNVPQRAEEIARLAAENLPPQKYFSRI